MVEIDNTAMQTKICCKCKKTKPAEQFSTKTKEAGGKKYISSDCKPCLAQRARDRYRVHKNSSKLRNKVLDILGKECVNCGYSDIRALQIDHVENNGFEERKIYKGQGMYRHILKVKGEGYQTLCANCNWIKRLENMNTSKSTKSQLINRLTVRYGAGYKSALARDLKVDVSTIRRIFNQRDELPLIYIMAFEKLLGE